MGKDQKLAKKTFGSVLIETFIEHFTSGQLKRPRVTLPSAYPTDYVYDHSYRSLDTYNMTWRVNFSISQWILIFYRYIFVMKLIKLDSNDVRNLFLRRKFRTLILMNKIELKTMKFKELNSSFPWNNFFLLNESVRADLRKARFSSNFEKDNRSRREISSWSNSRRSLKIVERLDREAKTSQWSGRVFDHSETLDRSTRKEIQLEDERLKYFFVRL